MSNEPRTSRLGVSTLVVVLVLSLSYNAIWISAAPGIVELQCKSHFAEVRLAAGERERLGNWIAAAHLYAYMLEFYPYAPDRCVPTSDEVGWKLPLGVLALEARYEPEGSTAAALSETDRDNQNASYLAALERATVLRATQPNASADATRSVQDNP